jgi:hypothetical protein
VAVATPMKRRYLIVRFPVLLPDCCARGEWPIDDRPSEQCDEIAASHSGPGAHDCKHGRLQQGFTVGEMGFGVDLHQQSINSDVSYGS